MLDVDAIAGYIQTAECSTPLLENASEGCISSGRGSQALLKRVEQFVQDHWGGGAGDQLSGRYRIADTSGNVQLSGKSLRSIGEEHQMMRSDGLNFYLRKCIDTDGCVIVPTDLTASLLSVNDDDAVRRLERLEKNEGKGDLFNLRQLHCLRCSGAHYSAISVIRIGGVGHHIHSNCSMGRPDRDLAELLHQLGKFYEQHGCRIFAFYFAFFWKGEVKGENWVPTSRRKWNGEVKGATDFRSLKSDF